MLAKMIDKIVSLKETKIFEIGGQTYTDGHLTRIPPHVDRPEAISVSGLDGVCKLIRTELERELEEGINRDITIMLGYQPPILIKPVIALNKEARSAVLEELKIVPTSTDYIAITVNMEGGADHE